ncbi:MAG: hypothetical protein K8E24_013055 [Methanobacterium paludis]|nr:hypothetical protein [Methanobacterium paludis]
MAIVEVQDVLLQGEGETFSGIVDTANVKKGMIIALGATGKGYVQPATTSANVVLGIALFDAEIGEEVTYVFSECTARVILAESQNITQGDRLTIGKTTIAAVDYIGEVAERTPGAFGDAYAKADANVILANLASDIGYAMESKTTGADVTAVLKIRFQGKRL